MPLNTAGNRTASRIARFGSFEADLEAGELFKNGIRIGLREQSFQVLASLLERPGQVITREELRQRLWHDDVFVDFDKSLNTAVARLREALGDPADHPRFIETLPKRGYRLIASVLAPPTHVREPKTNRIKLAVLPFVNLSGDAAEEYFSDAMTDEIITALASVAPEQLAVIARTTAMHYKGSHKGVARIGRELGVDYILEGSVRRKDNNVSLNVQLIETNDQTHLFAKRYDSELLDVFDVQNHLAQEVAASVPVMSGAIGEIGRRAKRKPTENVMAYNAYMQGRYYIHQWIPASIAKSKQCFQEAIARDPEFALAYSSLAELYGWMGWLGLVNPKDAFPAGVWAALRAIEIDNTLAQAHAMLGLFRKEHDCDWQEVQRRTAQALQLDPASPEIRFWRAGAYLLPLGKIEDAVVEIQHALEVDPLSVFLRCWLGLMFDFGRQYDQGLNEVKLALDLDSSSYIPHFVLGHLYRDKCMFVESIAAHRIAVERSGGVPLMLGWLGLPLALGGHTAEARSVLEHLYGIASHAYVPPTSFAWIHLGLGQLNDAFKWMDKAIDAHDPMMTPIRTYAFLDPIRTDPRFAALLRKMRLQDSAEGA